MPFYFLDGTAFKSGIHTFSTGCEYCCCTDREFVFLAERYISSVVIFEGYSNDCKLFCDCQLTMSWFFYHDSTVCLGICHELLASMDQITRWARPNSVLSISCHHRTIISCQGSTWPCSSDHPRSLEHYSTSSS